MMKISLYASEVEFLVEVLKTAKVEIEELERELDWYVTSVPTKIEEALEVLGSGPKKDD